MNTLTSSRSPSTCRRMPPRLMTASRVTCLPAKAALEPALGGCWRTTGSRLPQNGSLPDTKSTVSKRHAAATPAALLCAGEPRSCGRRVVRELIRHTPAPNRAMSFLFWNRTRRELALARTRCRKRHRVHPYLDHDVFDALMVYRRLSRRITSCIRKRFCVHIHTSGTFRSRWLIGEAPHMFHQRTALDLARRFSARRPSSARLHAAADALAALTGRGGICGFCRSPCTSDSRRSDSTRNICGVTAIASLATRSFQPLLTAAASRGAPALRQTVRWQGPLPDQGQSPAVPRDALRNERILRSRQRKPSRQREDVDHALMLDYWVSRQVPVVDAAIYQWLALIAEPAPRRARRSHKSKSCPRRKIGSNPPAARSTSARARTPDVTTVHLHVSSAARWRDHPTATIP